METKVVKFTRNVLQGTFKRKYVTSAGSVLIQLQSKVPVKVDRGKLKGREES